MINRALRVAAIGALLVAPAGLALAADDKGEAFAMTAGKGVSIDIGGKHAMTYFEAKNNLCSLTIVMASAEGGMGTDTPGTRISVLVHPAEALRIDAAQEKSAEFACAADGKGMSARVFDRAPYTKSAN